MDGYSGAIGVDKIGRVVCEGDEPKDHLPIVEDRDGYRFVYTPPAAPYPKSLLMQIPLEEVERVVMKELEEQEFQEWKEAFRDPYNPDIEIIDGGYATGENYVPESREEE